MEALNELLKNCLLDHVAIAVKDLDSAVSVYESLGLKFNSKREVVESEKVETAFAQIDDNSHIELLKATDDSSPIAKYIQKRGEGIHHLCFRVQDVLAKQNELQKKGMQFIYESPKDGANDCLVNFIHPKSTGGVLIELSEKKENT